MTASAPLTFAEFLAGEWRPSLGCTEPAAIAYATARAASCQHGMVRAIRLECDARTYKNCYSVGIPNSGGRTGILWTLAIGAHLGDPSKGLRCFEDTTAENLAEAADLLAHDAIRVEVAPPDTGLWIDVTVVRDRGEARVVIAREHTRIALVEVDGKVVEKADDEAADGRPTVREALAGMTLEELVALARTIGPDDRQRLREGAAMNIAMARRARGLLPEGFIGEGDDLTHSRFALKVAAGVYGRMSGLASPVMSLAGSGNKGITVAVPLALYGEACGAPQERIDEALALACLLTSATTWHLGTLSAMCGAANAAGIGVTAGVVWLRGGGLREIGTAIGTMVGNLAGMVCDGAKIGCAMKTMTGVDAAFRAANLAMLGLGVPATDGIVGADGNASLRNLGRLACQGMAGADAEILAIMQAKLRPAVSAAPASADG